MDKLTLLPLVRAYLDANPGTYGAMSDLEVAVSFNTPTISRIRSSMSGAEVMDATDPAEFATKTDAQKSQWLSLCAVDNVDPADGKLARDLAVSIFSGGSATVTALAAARQELISVNTQQGWGLVSTDDVTEARAL